MENAPLNKETVCEVKNLLQLNTLSQFTTDAEIEKLGEFFKVLTDPTRLKILYTLRGRELCVFDIAESVSASMSSVSHHLSLLKHGRLVKSRRGGREIYYSLDDDHVNVIIECARCHLCE